MDRRDYNDEERDVFNNDRGGEFIRRRRYNFSRSDYQNGGNVNSGANMSDGYASSQYAQPYSQANYQPTAPQYQPQPQPSYSTQQYQPQFSPQPQYMQPPQYAGQPTRQTGQGQLQYQEQSFDYDARGEALQMQKRKGLFSFKGKKQQQFAGGDMQNILIVTPKTLSEVQDIIDNLRNRQAIIVEFNRINEKYAERILDFLNGAIYALGGCEQRIADNMFLFTPGGVSIQGQIK